MIRFLTRCILTNRERNRVTYTADNLHGNAGLMLGAFWPGRWVVRINPKYSDDAGLLAHEMGHVADYLKHPWTYSFKMLLNWRYRWDRETHYYAVQLTYSPPEKVEKRLLTYAGFITTKYRLPIMTEQAIDRLRKEYERVKKRNGVAKSVAVDAK